LDEAALLVIELCEIVEVDGNGEAIESDQLIDSKIDSKAAFQERLGIAIVALVNIQQSKVRERLCEIWVIVAVALLANRERALVEPLGLGEVALGAIEPGAVVEDGGDCGMVGAERFHAHRKRPLVEPLGLGVAAL